MKLAHARGALAVGFILAVFATAAFAGRFQSAPVPTESGGFLEFVRSNLAMIAVVVGILLLAVFLANWIRRSADEAATQPVQEHLEPTEVPAPEQVPEPVPVEKRVPSGRPVVPEQLVDVCASGNTILLAGPGLGEMAGLRERRHVVSDLIFNSLKGSPSMQVQLFDLIEHGRSSFVMDAIATRVARDRIVETFKDHQRVPVLTEVHKSLRDMPFAGVLTTSWDDVCERTFAARRPVVVRSEDDAIEWLSQRRAFYVVKVHGDLNDAATVVVGSAELRNSVQDRPTLARIVTSESISRPMFIVGMAVDAIEEFFEAFRFHVRPSQPAFALTPYTPYWEAQVDRFQTRYGVTLIGYTPTKEQRDAETFLTQLAARVKKLARTRNVHNAPSLRTLRLTNIGVFEKLALEFTSGWNVILGNNGSGKSTILRAIAVALAGENADTQAAAQHLLRHGAKEGSIEVQVGEVVYRTDLSRRDRDRVTMKAAQLTPLQNGDWVVLGFPPLRGVSVRNPSGPSPVGTADPTVDDLLPLLRGALDTRVDSLKQWLVNIEVNSTGDAREARANRRLRDSFFEFLQKFTPGQGIRFARVDRKTWQAYVHTEDGEIPIDDVSQGMSSIIGWVGTLLQRMFEIHADAKEPTTGPALVLVDEIDAHLHPEWQQKLPGVIREHFPKLQIIGTTHSPLIVSSMTREEIFVALRNPTQRAEVFVSPSLIDPQGMRADQILTTPLFGLETTRNPGMAEKISRYAKLLGNRKPDEEREFLALREELATRLMYGETERELIEERAVIDASEERVDKLVARVAASSDEEAGRLRAAMTDRGKNP